MHEDKSLIQKEIDESFASMTRGDLALFLTKILIQGILNLVLILSTVVLSVWGGSSCYIDTGVRMYGAAVALALFFAGYAGRKALIDLYDSWVYSMNEKYLITLGRLLSYKKK